MARHLVRWHKEFAKKGLVIVDVDNGEMDSRDRLAAAVKEEKIPYATAWDQGGKTAEKYGVHAYPASYLIGTDGKVVWQGIALDDEGTGIAKSVLEAVEKELAKVTDEEKKKIENELKGD